MVIYQFPHHRAVLPADQFFRVFVSFISRDKVKGNPDVPLILRVDVRHVEDMMRGRVDIEPCPVSERDRVLAGIVVHELGSDRNYPGVFP